MDRITQDPHAAARRRDRPVVVFGGSGFLGRHLVQHLARLGYPVRVGVRRPNSALFLKPMGRVGQIEIAAADVRDTEGCAPLMHDAFAVINLVGILQESGSARFNDIHTKAPGHLARQATALGVTRFVQMSALGASVDSPARYAQSKARGEEFARSLFADTIVMRPSILFGPEDDFFNRFATMTRLSPVLPLIGGGRTRFQPIFVEDVARAVVIALERNDTNGKTFELGGSEILSFRQLLEKMLKTIERKRIFLPMPFFIAAIMARCTEWIPYAPLTADQLRMLRIDNIVSDEAIAQHRDCKALGIDPYPLQAVLPSYLARFRPAGEFAGDPLRRQK
ncbi:MAG: complex I NDUFA9 subunit family protein [Hyphomicrobiales bacterium]|nr:complex I NDUFA9 subunit family protein [Hyphomicrobiales bacterium]MCY4032707.1 complex I NDUFA9 subunit family protein [Hyphomicrobiales bacterium]